MSKSAPLDERYFRWLYSKIGSVTTRNPARNHWTLARQLHKKEFTYFIPNDDNRAEDGRDLRDEFLNQYPGLMGVDDWLLLECSMLEMLIALARRMAFESYDPDHEDCTGDWFWQIMSNLDLKRFTDAVTYKEREIDRILEVVINRTYRPDGTGGLFPLINPRTDQRKTEIWYQMSAFMMENDEQSSLSS